MEFNSLKVELDEYDAVYISGHFYDFNGFMGPPNEHYIFLVKFEVDFKITIPDWYWDYLYGDDDDDGDDSINIAISFGNYYLFFTGFGIIALLIFQKRKFFHK